MRKWIMDDYIAFRLLFCALTTIAINNFFKEMTFASKSSASG